MPAKKHDFTIAEIKAGIFVIMSVVVLALFMSVTSGLRPPEITNKYFTFSSDTAGLNKGADVRFGGVKVGRVTSIVPDKNDQSRVRVDIDIKQGIPVNQDSTAFITQTTLTSEKHLEITTGTKTAVLLKSGNEILFKDGGLFGQVDAMTQGLVAILGDVRELLGVEAINKATGEQKAELVSVAQIFENVETSVTESGGLLKDARGLVTDSQKDVSEILAKIKDVENAAQDLVKRIDNTVAENQPDIRKTISGVSQTVDEVNNSMKNVQSIIKQASDVADQLDGIVQTIQLTLNNANTASSDVQGILQQNRPVVDEMILDLRETVRHLKSFSRTMAEQPQAVIRGKAPQGRK